MSLLFYFIFDGNSSLEEGKSALRGDMVFSSISFLFYFLPTVFLIYYILSFSRRCQNFWLMIASLLFYAWGEPIYVGIMIFSILTNWLLGLWISAPDPKRNRTRKILLLAACVINFGVLGVFKYSGFVVDTLNAIFEREVIPYPVIALPIGISFFTFQAVSYVIDVYTGKAKAQKNILNIALYIAFFPQLIAGPIVKYSTIENQIYHRKSDWNGVSEGICRFCEGLAKKILIANNLAIIADTIFNLTKDGDTTVALPVLLAWLGAMSYMFQIYYDFSAYSDMAIGLGKMFGFQFQENFRYPFVAKSVREFMTRWHISLASWFSQYVYKPLSGGKKKLKMDLMIRNLFIVWFLTGLWHGAAWTFIYWGLFFFLFIVFEIFIRLDTVSGKEGLRHVYVLVVVMLSMVIFRSESNEQLSLYFSYLFGMKGNGFYSPWIYMFFKEYWPVFIGAVALALPLKDMILEKSENWRHREALYRAGRALYMIAMPLCMVFCVAVLAKGGYNPFIYFNF